MSDNKGVTNAMPAESGHWYDRATGEPRYRIVGKNGVERNTTLRDARVHGYAPSVTTVLQAAAKPGLERWKANQVLMAALTLPRLPDEAEDAWVSRVWEDSKQQAIKAAERGTAIHAAIEQVLRGEPCDSEFQPYVDAALECIDAKFPPPQPWEPEKSFACEMGYGGKVDLHAAGLVLDIKTKDGDVGAQKVWDEHMMQLAAYSHGLGMDEAGCGIVFVSRTQAQATLMMLQPDEVKRGWSMFEALLEYWYAQSGLAR